MLVVQLLEYSASAGSFPNLHHTHKTHSIDAFKYLVPKGHATISRCAVSDILLVSVCFSNATEETGT